MSLSLLHTAEWRRFSKLKMLRSAIFIQFHTNKCSGIMVLKILVFTTTAKIARKM